MVVLHPITARFIDIGEPSFQSWAGELNLTLEDDDFGVSTLDENEGRRNNRYHLRLFSVTPAYPDPVTVLRSLTAPFGKINRATAFAELDAMLTEAATELDAVRRHEKYLEIEDYVAEQALVIPIGITDSSDEYRYHPWVHDLVPPKYFGSVFHRVWLDHTAPKRDLPRR